MAAAFPDDPGATHFMPDDSPLYDEQAVWPDKDVDGARKLVDEYRAAHGGADITLTYVDYRRQPRSQPCRRTPAVADQQVTD